MRYLYAIMHRPTGKFLPRPPSGRKGGSWVEPVCPTEQTPRFFHRELDAKGFLTSWSKGPVVVKQYQDFSGDYDIDISHDISKAEAPRIKDDFEVVKIEWRVA